MCVVLILGLLVLLMRVLFNCECVFVSVCVHAGVLMSCVCW